MTASSSAGRGCAPIGVDSTRRPMGLLPDRCSTFYIAPCHTRNMRARVALRLGWAAIAAAVLLPINAAASTPRVEEADLNGDINTIMSSYIQSAVNRAEADHRSEEHTSELQSQSNLVCRLLLEKKK